MYRQCQLGRTYWSLHCVERGALAGASRLPKMACLNWQPHAFQLAPPEICSLRRESFFDNIATKPAALHKAREGQSKSQAMEPPFPTDIQEFDGDDRISFSKLDNRFIAVQDDGTEFEFDAERRIWQPLDDQDAAEGISSHFTSEGHPGSGPGKRRHDGDDGAEVSNRLYWQPERPQDCFRN